jgi:hypothetical protein
VRGASAVKGAKQEWVEGDEVEGDEVEGEGEGEEEGEEEDTTPRDKI